MAIRVQDCWLKDVMIGKLDDDKEAIFSFLHRRSRATLEIQKLKIGGGLSVIFEA